MSTAESLWEKAQEKSLGRVQHMDLYTINKIKSNHIIIPADINSSTSQVNITSEDIDTLKGLLPKLDYFKNKELYFSIHGISHLTRVMIYSLVISKILDTNPEPSVLIASLHDTGRLHDQNDIEHGSRASEYFLENHDVFIQKNTDLRNSIASAIKYHNIDYNQIPFQSLTQLDKFYIDIIKTADALDRFRLPKISWWPNVNVIPINILNSSLEIIKNFVVETELIFLDEKQKNFSLERFFSLIIKEAKKAFE